MSDHDFGAPMPDEYLLAYRKKIRAEVRERVERSRLRAATGLASVRPQSTVHGSPPRIAWWRRMMRKWRNDG